jgi:hypothetical protein
MLGYKVANLTVQKLVFLNPCDWHENCTREK